MQRGINARPIKCHLAPLILSRIFRNWTSDPDIFENENEPDIFTQIGTEEMHLIVFFLTFRRNPKKKQEQGHPYNLSIKARRYFRCLFSLTKGLS